MAIIAEIVDEESPAIIKLRLTARILFWASVLWGGLNVFTVCAHALLFLLQIPVLKEGQVGFLLYNLSFGLLNLGISFGAWQMSRLRRYQVGVMACVHTDPSSPNPCSCFMFRA